MMRDLKAKRKIEGDDLVPSLGGLQDDALIAARFGPLAQRREDAASQPLPAQGSRHGHTLDLSGVRVVRHKRTTAHHLLILFGYQENPVAIGRSDVVQVRIKVGFEFAPMVHQSGQHQRLNSLLVGRVKGSQRNGVFHGYINCNRPIKKELELKCRYAGIFRKSGFKDTHAVAAGLFGVV